MQRDVEGEKSRILRSEEPVRMYWPVPEEKVRVFIGLGGVVGGLRRVTGVVGKVGGEDIMWRILAVAGSEEVWCSRWVRKVLCSFRILHGREVVVVSGGDRASSKISSCWSVSVSI